MRLFVSCLLLLVLGTPWPALADRTVASDKPIKLRLPLGKPVSVQFPEKIVRVPALELPDVYTFEAVGVYFYLTARHPEVDHRLFIVGETGQQYQVDFVVGTPPDVIVKVARPPAPAASKAAPFDLESWFRALRFQHPIPGQQLASVPAPLPADGRIAVLSSGAVSRGELIGMVIQLQNTTDRPLFLEDRLHERPRQTGEHVVLLDQWTWPPRLTIEALAPEDPVLQPGASTRLYVVFTKR